MFHYELFLYYETAHCSCSVYVFFFLQFRTEMFRLNFQFKLFKKSNSYTKTIGVENDFSHIAKDAFCSNQKKINCEYPLQKKNT